VSHLQFHVWCEERGGTEENRHVIYSYSHEKAAEQWAEWSDSQGDYDIIGGADVTVSVRLCNASEVRRFTVTGESVPRYYAEKAPPTRTVE
jgi:hypothetical protein